MKRSILLIPAIASAIAISAQPKVEPIKYGDFENWVTRHINESSVLGGNTRTLYEIAPTATIEGNKAYTPRGGSPWGTSNVYAKVKGISKGSNAVYPCARETGGHCAKLCSELQGIKVLGMVNMEVMVAGSIFLGHMLEPVSGTSNPYSKMEMGVPFTERPQSLVVDYKVDMPSTNTRIKSSGFGSKKTLAGRDEPVIFIFLQRRWEDADGNIHAARVATGGEKFSHGSGWVNGHAIPLKYGNASAMGSWLGLRNNANNMYYARNSKGKMVPVHEESWDAPDAVPTHAIVMISAGSGDAYVGTPGLTFYVDNVGWGF